MRFDNITPTFDRVLIEKVKEEKTDTGIFIPLTSEEENTYKAKVLATGPDVNVKGLIGAIVLVGKYAGTELVIDSGVVVVNIKDILGTVTE